LFTIPNVADAAYSTQAEIDSKDLDIVTAAFLRTFVLTGCLVSEQSTPDMTVKVASGTVRINATLVVTPGAGVLAIGASDPVLGRFDFVTVDLSGVCAIVAGTAAAVPVFPAIPASRVVLAAVYVPPSAITVLAATIIDKRILSTLQVIDVGVPPTPGTGLLKSGELTGTIDGANKVFTIPTDYAQGTFTPFIGGIMIRGSDYALSGTGNKTVTFGASVPAPAVGEWVGGLWQT
jgi:hypothetical protein